MSDSTNANAGLRERLARGASWLELAVLSIFVTTRASGYGDHVDFHMEDELSSYLHAGRELVRSGAWPELALAPFSSLVYGLLSLLPLGGWPPTDVMYWLCVLAAPVLLWWALRPVLPAPLPLAVAAWCGSATQLLQSDCVGGMAIVHVYAFNAAIVFTAVGACARRRFGWSLILLAIAAWNRVELMPWFAAFGLTLVAWRSTGWSSGRRGLVAALVLAQMAIVFSDVGVRQRPWGAFQQHYARAAVAEELAREAGRSPQGSAAARLELERAFAQPSRVAIDFPTATSIPAALRENPSGFLHHVWRNVCEVPSSLVTAQTTTLLPRAAARVVLGLLGALAAIGWLLRRRGRWAEPAWPLPLWILLATSPLALGASMVVAARGELMWPLFPTWAVLLAGGIAALWARVPRRAGMSPLAAIALLAVAFAVPGPFAGPPRRLQHRDALALLTAQPPLPNARLLCAWYTYPELIDRWDVAAIVPVHLTAASLAEFAAGRLGDLILRTPDLARQVQSWSVVESVLGGASSWRVAGELGDATLYVRRVEGR